MHMNLHDEGNAYQVKRELNRLRWQGRLDEWSWVGWMGQRLRLKW